MSNLTAGREALEAIKALPPEDAAERLAAALGNILDLAEDWKGGANTLYGDSEAFGRADGRDDAANEIEQAISRLTDEPLPLSA